MATGRRFVPLQHLTGKVLHPGSTVAEIVRDFGRSEPYDYGPGGCRQVRGAELSAKGFARAQKRSWRTTAALTADVYRELAT